MNFDTWYDLYSYPYESREDAAERYIEEQGVDDPAQKQGFLDSLPEYREVDVQKERQQYTPLTFGDYTPTPIDLPDPEYEDDPDWWDQLKAGADEATASGASALAGPVSGFLSEYVSEDIGEGLKGWAEDWRDANLAEAAQVKRPETREEILARDPDSWYKYTPEFFPTGHEIVRSTPTSLAAAGIALPAAVVAGKAAGVVGLAALGKMAVGAGTGMVAGNVASSLQVAGEAYERAKNDPVIREELGVDPNKDFKDLLPEDQQKIDRFATDLSQSSFGHRLYTSGLLEMASFIPYGPILGRWALDTGLGTTSELMDRELYAEDAADKLVEYGLPRERALELQEKMLNLGPSEQETFIKALVQEGIMGGGFSAFESITGASDYRVNIPATGTRAVEKQHEEMNKELDKQLFKYRTQLMLPHTATWDDVKVALDNKRGVEDEKAEVDNFKRMNDLTNQGALDEAAIEEGFVDDADRKTQLKIREEKLKESKISDAERDRLTLEEAENEAVDEARRSLTEAEARHLSALQGNKLRQALKHLYDARDKRVRKAYLEILKERPFTEASNALKEAKLAAKETLDKPGFRRTAEEKITVADLRKQEEALDAKFPLRTQEEEKTRMMEEAEKRVGTNFAKIKNDTGKPTKFEKVKQVFGWASKPKKELGKVKLSKGITKALFLDLVKRNPQYKGKFEIVNKEDVDAVAQAFTDGGRTVWDAKLNKGKGGERKAEKEENTAYAKDALENARAWTFGDKIFMNADVISGPTRSSVTKQLVELGMFHEPIAHIGLKNYLGDDYKGFLDNFYKTNERDIKLWVNKEAKNYLSEVDNINNLRDSEKQLLAEEFLANKFVEFGVRDPNIIARVADQLVSSAYKALGRRRISTVEARTILAEIQRDYIGGERNIITGDFFDRSNWLKSKAKSDSQIKEDEEKKDLLYRTKQVEGAREPRTVKGKPIVEEAKVKPETTTTQRPRQVGPAPAPEKTGPQKVMFAKRVSTQKKRELWQKTHKPNPVQEIKRRDEDLKKLAKDLEKGEITFEEYRSKYEKVHPIRTFDTVPKLSSMTEIAGAINQGQYDKGKLIGEDSDLKAGMRANVRFDVDSMNKYNVGVVTAVSPEAKGSHYGRAAHLAQLKDGTPVKMITNQKKGTLKIATGEGKFPMAFLKGIWKGTSAAQIKVKAQKALKDPNWIQVGMNPTRQSSFYARETKIINGKSIEAGTPIATAEEVLQVGMFVIAKNPTTQAVPTFPSAEGKEVRFAKQPSKINKKEIKQLSKDILSIKAVPANRVMFSKQRIEKYKATDGAASWIEWAENWVPDWNRLENLDDVQMAALEDYAYYTQPRINENTGEVTWAGQPARIQHKLLDYSKRDKDGEPLRIKGELSEEDTAEISSRPFELKDVDAYVNNIINNPTNNGNRIFQNEVNAYRFEQIPVEEQVGQDFMDELSNWYPKGKQLVKLKKEFLHSMREEIARTIQKNRQYLDMAMPDPDFGVHFEILKDPKATQAQKDSELRKARAAFFKSALMRASVHDLGPTRVRMPKPFTGNGATIAEVAQMFENGEITGIKHLSKVFREKVELAEKRKALQFNKTVKLGEGQWIELKQVPEDATQEEADEIINNWNAQSDKEWCTSLGMEKTYAYEGPMWVYQEGFGENAESKMAIRFEGDIETGEVVEIQSQTNDGTIPAEYLPAVKEFSKEVKLGQYAQETIDLAEAEAKGIALAKSLADKDAKWKYARLEKEEMGQEKLEASILPLKDGTFALRAKGRNTKHINRRFIVQAKEAEPGEEAYLRRYSIIIGDVALDLGADAVVENQQGWMNLSKEQKAERNAVLGDQPYFLPENYIRIITGEAEVHGNGNMPALEQVKSLDVQPLTYTSEGASPRHSGNKFTFNNLNTVTEGLSIKGPIYAPKLESVHGGLFVTDEQQLNTYREQVQGKKDKDSYLYDYWNDKEDTVAAKGIPLYHEETFLDAPNLRRVSKGKDSIVGYGQAFRATGDTKINVPSLELLDGNIQLKGKSQVFPALTHVTGDITSSWQILPKAKWPKDYMEGETGMDWSGSDLASIDHFPSLHTIDGDLRIEYPMKFNSLVSVAGLKVYAPSELKNLTYVRESVELGRKVEVPNLKYIGQQLETVEDNSFPSLVDVNGNTIMFKGFIDPEMKIGPDLYSDTDADTTGTGAGVNYGEGMPTDQLKRKDNWRIVYRERSPKLSTKRKLRLKKDLKNFPKLEMISGKEGYEPSFRPMMITTKMEEFWQDKGVDSFKAFYTEDVRFSKKTTQPTASELESEFYRKTGKVKPDTEEPTMGVNINDKTLNFTELILSGRKTMETRDTDSLRAYVGKEVGIIRTGKGPAQLVGYMTVGEPVVYNNRAEFKKDQSKHLVKTGSDYDIKSGGKKYGYPITNVTRVVPSAVTSRGIVARKIKTPMPKDKVSLGNKKFTSGTYVKQDLGWKKILNPDGNVRSSRVMMGNAAAHAIGTRSWNPLTRWTEKTQPFADKLLERMIAQGTLPDSAKYKDLRRLLKGAIYKAEQGGKMLYDALAKSKQKDVLFKYFTTKGYNANLITDRAERQAAIEAKEEIHKIGKELVDRNLLHEAAFKELEGAYLPRVYLKYLLGEKNFNNVRAGAKLDMKYLEGRKDIPEGVRKLLMHEVEDPAYLGSKAIGIPRTDMAILDFLQQIALNPKWVLPQSMVTFDVYGELRDLAVENNLSKEIIDSLKSNIGLLDTKKNMVSAHWLNTEATRIRKTAPDAGLNQAERDTLDELTDKMMKASEGKTNENWEKYESDNFRQIPKSIKYGSLAGMWVRKEIASDLFGGMNVATGDISTAEAILGDGGIIGDYNRLWKWAKVSANPPSWVRNFVSNMILMNMGGVPVGRMPDLILSSLADMRKGGKHKGRLHQLAKDLGLTAGTFSNVELGRIEKEFKDLQRRMQSKKSAPWAVFGAIKGAFNKVRDVTGDIYGGIDSLGKMMMLRYYMDQKNLDIKDISKYKGKELNNLHEIATQAEKWLFDYSNVLPSVKWLRRAPLGAPFMSFTSFVAPLMLETAITKPWKFAPYYAIGWGMKEWFKNNFDLDDEDLEALKIGLSDYLREKAKESIFPTGVIPLPFLDENKRVQWLDISYLYPWGMFSEMAGEIADGQIGEAIKTAGLMGSPLFNIASAVSTGIDPFSRKEIVDPMGTPTEQAMDIWWYAFNLTMPPFMHGAGWGNDGFGAALRVYDAFMGNLAKDGEAKFTILQASLRAAGINITPLAVPEGATKQLKFEQSKIRKMIYNAERDIKNMVIMMKSQSEIQEAIKDYRTKIIARVQEWKDKVRRSIPPESIAKPRRQNVRERLLAFQRQRASERGQRQV